MSQTIQIFTSTGFGKNVRKATHNLARRADSVCAPQIAFVCTASARVDSQRNYSYEPMMTHRNSI